MKIDINSLQSKNITEDLTKQALKDLELYWDSGNGLNKEMVEIVDCSLCNENCPESTIFIKNRFPYRKCPNCELVYPSPRPKLEYIYEQYVSGRFSNTFHELYLPTADYRMKTIFKERVLDLIKPKVGSGRLLDIGCSSGHFLKVAKDNNFDTFGVEPNPDMVQFANKELNLDNIVNGTLEDAKFDDEYFDIITLWDVLEHVVDPYELLVGAHRVLKPGGWIFAYTENYESYNIRITGKYSEMVTPDVHLRHYSPKTFKREFEKAKYIIDKIYTEGLDVQHINKTLKTFPEKFSGIDFGMSDTFEDELQNLISKHNYGDNLRLIAKKE
jgi:2-polyprenyl-3-methyl-5-hydroxy-6-metoxy-1,4-benzoquinol methylase